MNHETTITVPLNFVSNIGYTPIIDKIQENLRIGKWVPVSIEKPEGVNWSPYTVPEDKIIGHVHSVDPIDKTVEVKILKSYLSFIPYFLNAKACTFAHCQGIAAAVEVIEIKCLYLSALSETPHAFTLPVEVYYLHRERGALVNLTTLSSVTNDIRGAVLGWLTEPKQTSIITLNKEPNLGRGIPDFKAIGVLPNTVLTQPIAQVRYEQADSHPNGSVLTLIVRSRDTPKGSRYYVGEAFIDVPSDFDNASGL